MAIRRINENDVSQIVTMLMIMRERDNSYPSPAYAEANRESLEEWFLADELTERWVLSIDDRVIGHIGVKEPGDYLIEHFEKVSFNPANPPLELSKLFVHPDYRSAGAASTLLDHSIHYAIEQNHTPVLTVLATSKEARRIYERKLNSIGTFTWSDGLNYVFNG